MLFLVCPALGFAGVADFLCEVGVKFYQQGDYDNALLEFEKVLLCQPGNEVALHYINLIKQEAIAPAEREGITEAEQERRRAIRTALEEAEEEMALIREVAPARIVSPEKKPLPPREGRPAIKKKPAEILILDAQVRATQPDTLLEIEMEKPLLIQGEGIRRYLVTAPQVVTVARKTADQIEIRPVKLGTTFLHIWDARGRWTFKVQNIPPQPPGPTLEEIQRQELEKAENFKIRYSFTRDAYYLGTKPSNLERETLSVNQWVGIEGESPYGRLDSSARIAKLKETTDLTYLTVGLTDGQLGGLEDFDLRGFDYNMYASELVFPGISLRGLRFDHRLHTPESNYTLFWGREGQGAFGRLSPGLAETKDSFLEGGRFFFQPWEALSWQFGYYHGHGDERDPSLRLDSLDLMLNLDTERWKLSAQGGYDSEEYAFLVDSVFTFPGLRIRTEYRDIYPDYLTIIGRPSRLGERGGLALVEFSGIENLFFSQRVDVYRDRLYPNPERPGMWNIELDSTLNYRWGERTNFNLNFRYWDEKGKISPRRERSMGGGFSHCFDFLKKRDLSFYSDYRYQQTKNFDSITSDFLRHRVIAGARLNLFPGFYTFASQEYSWLKEISPEEYTHPRAWEAGIDFDRQLGRLPVEVSLRAYFREEKDAHSLHSFLAAEDSFEVQAELSFQPAADWEIFVDGRLRKVWPDNPAEAIYTEGEFITGARLLFDTGITWNPQGEIAGVVFKDVDGDGLRDAEEPGLEGVRIFLGKEESVLSDAEGKFYFARVRAKQVGLSLDLGSVPPGFLPTTATFQEVSIKQDELISVNFGLSVRSEIVGSVFVDTNGNGRHDAQEAGVKDVLLSLEDGRQTKTDVKGKFYFRKVAPGEHILTFDVHTVPIHLLPKVPVQKKISLDEGMSYIYNIPLEPVR